MSEQLKYVSPEYQKRLEDLGDTLMAGVRERLAKSALEDTVELSVSEQLELEYGTDSES